MNSRQKPFPKLIEDTPICRDDEDKLGFMDYASAIGDSLLSSTGPLTVGVFGDWGVGKTSLMRLIKHGIETSAGKDIITVWFNAWQYESESHPIVPLCASIISEIQSRRGLARETVESLIRSLRSVVYGFSLKAKAGVPLLSEVTADLAGKDIVDRQEELSEKLTDKFLTESLYYRCFDALQRTVKDLRKFRVVVLIDDLDRCLPENAMKLLESVKLVLSESGFNFVFGLDRRTVCSFISEKYSKTTCVSGEQYLAKMFQVSFFIPDHSRLAPEYANSLIMSHMGAEAISEFSALLPAIGDLCWNNPRAIKRFLNSILIDRAIALRRTELRDIPMVSFGFARALQMHWPMVADAIRWDDDGIREKLSTEIYRNPDGPDASVAALAADERDVNAPVYRNIMRDRSLRDVLISQASAEWLSSPDLDACWTLLLERPTEHPVASVSHSIEPGIRFERPELARITDVDQIYDLVVRTGWCKERIKMLFPDLFSDVEARADGSHWDEVGWNPHSAEEGKALGTILHSDGTMMYLVEFDHRGTKVYGFVAASGIELSA